VIPDVFKTTDIVVGKVTTVPVTAGEQILPAKLTSTGVELTQFKGDLPVSVVIPEGRRGFSVLVSEVSAVGGLLRPGNYVDVISSQEVVSATDSSKTVGTACYLSQDIEVLAVAQQVIGSRGAAAETAEGIAGAPADSAAKSVTLAVTPQEAGALAAAQRSVSGADVGNQLWLSVRPFGEHGVLSDLPGCTQ
jgi:pilus assembly protein CpaB